MSDPFPRELTAEESELLLALLRQAGLEGADELAAQVDCTRVVGGTYPTFLDLEIVEGSHPAPFETGPLQGFFLVEDESGEASGEIIMWIDAGYLATIEYAWYTDDPPRDLPSPAQIRVGGMPGKSSA